MFWYPSVVILVSVVVLITCMLAYTTYSGLQFTALQTSTYGMHNTQHTTFSHHDDTFPNSTFGVHELFTGIPLSPFSLQCVLFLSILLYIRLLPMHVTLGLSLLLIPSVCLYIPLAIVKTLALINFFGIQHVSHQWIEIMLLKLKCNSMFGTVPMINLHGGTGNGNPNATVVSSTGSLSSKRKATLRTTDRDHRDHRDNSDNLEDEPPKKRG